MQIVLNDVFVRRRYYGFHLGEMLIQIRLDRRTDDVLRRKMPSVDQVASPRILNIVVALTARHERIAALRNGLRDILAARAAADGYAVHPPAAAAIAQAAAAE